METRLNVLVMGAGAIGSVVGGLLSNAGHRVSLVGRAPHMEAIRSRGLRISGIWGEHKALGLRVATELPAFAHEKFDVIILAVKAYDTPAAVEALVPWMGAETLVCAYQNGLGNAESIAAIAGWENTVGVRAIYGARIPEPGRVEVTVMAHPTALGMFNASERCGRVRYLAEAMNNAGLPTVYSENIAQVIWAKVAYNCALNPLSALLDVPYGRLAELEDTRQIMAEVIEEVYQVAERMGLVLQPTSAEAYQSLFYRELVPPTAVHYASMREDLRQGRRTEIDALNGAIVRFGEVHAAACPANRLLTRLVHAREQPR